MNHPFIDFKYHRVSLAVAAAATRIIESSAFFGWLVNVDGQFPLVQGSAVEHLNGGLGFGARAHHDVGKTPGAVRFTIFHQFHGFDRPRCGEERLQIVLAGFEGQIANIEFVLQLEYSFKRAVNPIGGLDGERYTYKRLYDC
jgi:hypothetical protein